MVHKHLDNNENSKNNENFYVFDEKKVSINLNTSSLSYKLAREKWFSLVNCLFPICIVRILKKQNYGNLGNRQDNLVKEGIKLYPRICYDKKYLEIYQAVNTWKETLKNGERVLNIGEVTIRGRIYSVRASSSKLFFYDIYASGAKIQAVCSLRAYKGDPVIFLKINRNLRRGDVVEMTGILGKTNIGEFSIFITSKIQLLAPCLCPLPLNVKDIEKRFENRHVDFLVHPETSDYIILRSKILTYIRTFLLNKNFLEVETPILGGSVGGANARSFYTYANSLRGKKIFLRIAPELWLKRLVIGGFDRIFEIGKCFRNEGIDSNHNPEFTMCEFYQTYTSLEDLIEITKSLLSGLIKELINSRLLKGNILSLINNGFLDTYKILDFISSLEEWLNMPFPDLDSSSAIDKLLYIATEKNISLVKPYTINRILDQLSSKFLESQHNGPTFIINHPQIMSPLAKSSIRNNQKIAHRGELYIFGKEICNFYEEENDPCEQYSKMLHQQRDRDYAGDSDAQIADLNYIDSLKWGLPPTGGWGMGIDRLCMILCNSPKINEVLSFGNLRMTCNSDLILKNEKYPRKRSKEIVIYIKKSLKYLFHPISFETCYAICLYEQQKMQYVGKAFGTMSRTWSSINPATLSGAIDVIVIEQANGDLACSPFHVRFGKFSMLRPSEKKVTFRVNNEVVQYSMKLGDEGDAFFVFSTESDVPDELKTSPVISPSSSPQSSEETNLQEPDEFDLSEHGSRTQKDGMTTRSSDFSCNVDDISQTGFTHHETWNMLSIDHSSNIQHGTPKIQRASSNNSDFIRKKTGDVSPSDSNISSSSPELKEARLSAIKRASELSRRLLSRDIPTHITDNGDVILDMRGYKSSDEAEQEAEAIVRRILSEIDINSPELENLISSDSYGNIWIYASENSKEDAINRGSLFTNIDIFSNAFLALFSNLY
ncbi:hypothetical protein PORY_000783 [Pneumocystis oryctolagi]|uniref:Uncharacterized protein n=1 Tax=Pneumocystis oryctolagi TaxID=42067 RepID=A0ACB7CFX2_9ASCO|nr:hypothetical protein PORY_000783 [Pneumocystis oryctolagi]